ncbi:winged helix-turn-helix domain-containing protein [bacterium]|nr:MAG: winged helix-turn-helix domain-containing protein [bacterium]
MLSCHRRFKIVPIKFHINLKARRCQYLFHELGFTLQRPRPVADGDPVAQAEFKKNRKNSGRNKERSNHFAYVRR